MKWFILISYSYCAFILQFPECNQIRLVGSSRCSGRVEVYHRDSWGTVCDDLWSLTNADVVCRELNCGTVLEAKKGAFFGQGKDEIWLDDVQCTGHETSILKCQHRPLGENNCGHGEDAGVVCSGKTESIHLSNLNVRVVNGSNRCNGRVEVFHEGQWKRACASDWGRDEAAVICQEIRCGTPIIQTDMPYFGEARHLLGVKTTCSGNETSLSQCTLKDFKETCVDATVFCSSNNFVLYSKAIRLINGTHRCAGRVEVFHDGQWGTICDDRWGIQEAAVACREMNCGNPLSVKYKAFYGRGQDQVWMDDVECTGHEKSLTDCPHRGFGEHDCDHAEDAGVECIPTLTFMFRLTNGTNQCSGRVEIFHNGNWGKICNNNWGLKEATVVCKELGCGTPKKASEHTNFGENIWLDDVRCFGNETSLLHCRHPSLGDNNCGHGEDAGVVCSGIISVSMLFTSFLLPLMPQMNTSTIRLINGTDQCSGRVEVHHGDEWLPVYNVNWGMHEATVTCREMNCGDAVKTTGSFGQGGDLRGYKISCSGTESSLTQCGVRDYTRTSHDRIEEAVVECSGKT
uniref:Soluble scavenger receptor cysteine-rich domain-containing protein SSC5D n=1 Tax=Lates calcarifer TaxID=8187 RepID=A0A4W6E315_LATCA